MRDIAERTGLGLATISKYLNGGTVREKNRLAIEQAIRELDFTVNEFARSLKTRRSKTIGIVIPELCNLFITSVIMVLEDELRRRGYGVLVCDSRSDPELEREAISFLLGKMADGVVLVSVAGDGGTVRALQERKVPLVLLDREVEGLEGEADVVLSDGQGGARCATEYILARGHRQVGVLVGPRGVNTSQDRLRGYREALESAGVPFEARLTADGCYTVEGGYRAMRELYTGNPDLTAVFATNYEMTLGAVLALGELGVPIGEAVSVVGFDNLDLARVVRPRLTIVSQPLEELGRQAARLLLSRLEEGRTQAARVLLPTQLLEGDSVRQLAPEGGGEK